MKTAAKAALITAAAFIVLGLCMIFGSFALGANPHTVGENLGGVHIRIDSHGIHSDDRYHDDFDDRYDDYDDYNEEFEDKLEDWLEQNPGIDADFGDIF